MPQTLVRTQGGVPSTGRESGIATFTIANAYSLDSEARAPRFESQMPT